MTCSARSCGRCSRSWRTRGSPGGGRDRGATLERVRAARGGAHTRQQADLDHHHHEDHTMAQFIQAFLKIGDDYIRGGSIVGGTIKEKHFTGEKVEKSRTYRLATIRLASGQSYEYKD